MLVVRTRLGGLRRKCLLVSYRPLALIVMHTEPARPLGIRFAELGHTSALRAPGGGRPSLRAASGPRNQLLGAARPGRAAQQHSALGPIWAFLGHTSPRDVVAGTFSNWRLAQGMSGAG